MYSNMKEETMKRFLVIAGGEREIVDAHSPSAAADFVSGQLLLSSGQKVLVFELAEEREFKVRQGGAYAICDKA
jgi:hypothetical protein